MLEHRIIGKTSYSIHDNLDELLGEAERARPQRVFSYAEEGSGEYELIAGFAEHSTSASVYLAPEPLGRSLFEPQQQQFQHYLALRQIPSLRGRIEVAGGGEILEFFDEEKDWQKSRESEANSPLSFVKYGGRVYMT